MRRSLVMLSIWVAAWVVPGGRLLAETPAGTAESILSATAGRRGLVVHLDCGDGALTAKLARGRKLIVHGLARDAADVEKARALLAAEGLAGQVTVEQNPLRQLPYADGIVNLVVAEDFASLRRGGLTLAEVMRTVCPGGVALLGGVDRADLKTGDLTAEPVDGCVKITKPAPKGVDQWPTLMHGPDGNPVSSDRLAGPPTTVRWIAARPLYPTGHRKSSNVALATGGGKVFTVCPELTDQGRGRQVRITARDAYNGLMLWKHSFLKARVLMTKPYGMVSAYRTKRPWPLIAAGERVFTINGKEVIALDADTGRVLRRYGPKGYFDQVLFKDGCLLAASQGELMLIEADTGKRRWTKAVKAIDTVIEDGCVYALDAGKSPYDVLKLDFATGREVLRVGVGSFADIPKVRRGGKAIMLVFCKDGAIVLARTSGYKSKDKLSTTYAISAEDGRLLWKYAAPTMHGYLTHHFFIDGLIWIESGKYRAMRWKALDPISGEPKRSLDLKAYPLNKCQRSTATVRYYVNGRGIGLIEWASGKVAGFGGARGSCRLGMTPANGMFYSNPVSCGCGDSWVRGYLAMASEATAAPAVADGARLVKGPAFGQVDAATRPAAAVAEWPSWRGGPRRTAATAQQVPADVKVLWEARVGERVGHFVAGGREGDFITAPVVAAGRAVVAETDLHRVRAFDPADGKGLWSFTAGGRIDSPPTIHGGLCLFGSADGWVYCLRASDGKLVWRFLAAPVDRKIPAYGQLESIWPVPGSVMVASGVACVVAGRSSHSDGGMTVYGLAPATGRMLWKRAMTGYSRKNRGGIKGLNDILVSDGASVHLHRMSIQPATGKTRVVGGHPDPKRPRLYHNKVGLAGGIWRYYQAPNRANQSTIGDGRTSPPRATRIKLLVIDGQASYAFAFCESNGTGARSRGTASLFRQSFDADGKKTDPAWSVKVPDGVRYAAMVKAGKTLFCAGLKDRFNPATGFVEARSAEDGRLIGQIDIPCGATFDGLAVAGERLYVTTRDGRLLCLGR